MRELLIVGVDPGTTTAYAVLDTTGKLIKARSSKQLELNSLVEEIVQLGSILAIGTDKQKCPQLIEKIAAKTGAKTFLPDYDLPVAEKEGMTSGFSGNQHEKDSLAAALYAYKELEPLLQRIGKALSQEGKHELFMEVTRTVVMEGINIKEALRNVERQMAEKNQKREITNDPPAATAVPKERVLLKQLGRENEILRGYVSKLLGRIRKAEKDLSRMEKSSRQGSRTPLKEKIDEKEKNHAELLAKLQRILNEKDRQVGRLKAEMQQMEAILAAGNFVVKKLDTLGFGELQQKNSSLKIGEKDIVLVENPDIFSEKTLNYLQERGVTILTRKEISSAVARILHDAELAALPAEGIILKEAGNFASADREKLEQARKKHYSNVLGLIESYKEERKIELM